jgi:NADPH:quinone reductase-like Zn-dependent oxidoreductase
MRAVGFSRFGGPEVLEVVDLPMPEPGPNEIRIRVMAATVNPTDLGMRGGNRAEALAAFQPPYVAGMELAGVVDAIGPDTDWLVADRVMAIVVPLRTGRGAQAEQVVVPADQAAPMPSEDTSFEDAATLPMNGLTARRALDLLALQTGQTLAVTGAAGAVGGYVTQLAALEGLRVIAVSAATDEPLLRELGAHDFVPRSTDVASSLRQLVPNGVDAIVDAAVIGRALLAAIRDGGQLAAVRAFDGEPERGITVHAVRVSDYAHNQEALRRLSTLAANGQLRMRVAETVPPERAADAHRKLAAGGVRGRLVIVF